MITETIDVAVIGGGPAGLTAALYAARARVNTVVFERGIPGGQIITTERIENYPGFPGGLGGPELGELMTQQAEEFGAQLMTFNDVERVEKQEGGFVITADGQDYWAKSVILATGAVPRKLGVPGEAEFTGRGVSWCATCDGALYKDKVVAVVGGGDKAVEEAMFLSKFAREVHIIHRREEFRATKCIQERCFLNEKMYYHWNRTVREILGDDGKVTGVVLASTTGEPDETLELDGVFIFVGVDPLSELAKPLCELDDAGFVKTDHDGRTSLSGLYAAGDVTDSELKQVVTAAAKGASAAFEAVRYLEEVDVAGDIV